MLPHTAPLPLLPHNLIGSLPILHFALFSLHFASSLRGPARAVAISFFILHFSIYNGWDLPPFGRNVAAWHTYRTHRNSTPPQQCSRRAKALKNGIL